MLIDSARDKMKGKGQAAARNLILQSKFSEKTKSEYFKRLQKGANDEFVQEKQWRPNGAVSKVKEPVLKVVKSKSAVVKKKRPKSAGGQKKIRINKDLNETQVTNNCRNMNVNYEIAGFSSNFIKGPIGGKQVFSGSYKQRMSPMQ